MIWLNFQVTVIFRKKKSTFDPVLPPDAEKRLNESFMPSINMAPLRFFSFYCRDWTKCFLIDSICYHCYKPRTLCKSGRIRPEGMFLVESWIIHLIYFTISKTSIGKLCRIFFVPSRYLKLNFIKCMSHGQPR